MKDAPRAIAGMSSADEMSIGHLFKSPMRKSVQLGIENGLVSMEQNLSAQPAKNEHIEKAGGDSVAGLRHLSMDDLPSYKAALGNGGMTTFQHYFPFLYFFSLQAKTDEFLIAEEEGSICIYRRKLTAAGLMRLRLAFLPMPMNVTVLKSCLDRIREHNRSRTAIVLWVEEKGLAAMRGLENLSVTPREPEYIYSPRIFKTMNGGKFRHLRHNLRYMQARDNVEIRPYAHDDLAACLKLMDQWAEFQEDKYDKILGRHFTKNCLKFAHMFDVKDLFGRVVLMDGKICSFGFAGEMCPGLASMFLAYSDHRIKGLNYLLKYNLILALEDYELINDGEAASPGLKFSKQSLCPVAMNNIFRVSIMS
jgi:hypothetical protein